MSLLNERQILEMLPKDPKGTGKTLGPAEVHEVMRNFDSEFLMQNFPKVQKVLRDNHPGDITLKDGMIPGL